MSASPLLGNGFSLTDAAGGVNFDLNADGTSEHIAWTAVGSDDAFLDKKRRAYGVTQRYGVRLEFVDIPLDPLSFQGRN